jgi:AraC-like DNA-binding protein
MITTIHRYRWDAPRDHGALFGVYSHGLNEPMPTGIVNYRSEDDWLLVFFNDPVEVDLGHGLTTVPENSLVIWSPRDGYRYGNRAKAWLHSWIHVAGTDVPGILAAAGMKPLTPIQVGQSVLVEQYLGQIFGEISAHPDPDGRILRNLFENWLLEMARATVGQARGRLPSEPLRRLKRQLDRQGGGRLSLQEMAQIANLSPSHLSAEFKRCFGVSPGLYQIRHRMDEARYLLKTSGLSVSEVAQQAGYPSLFQFSRMFKRIVGISPREYRAS